MIKVHNRTGKCWAWQRGSARKGYGNVALLRGTVKQNNLFNLVKINAFLLYLATIDSLPGPQANFLQRGVYKSEHRVHFLKSASELRAKKSGCSRDGAHLKAIVSHE